MDTIEVVMQWNILAAIAAMIGQVAARTHSLIPWRCGGIGEVFPTDMNYCIRMPSDASAH